MPEKQPAFIGDSDLTLRFEELDRSIEAHDDMENARLLDKARRVLLDPDYGLGPIFDKEFGHLGLSIEDMARNQQDNGDQLTRASAGYMYTLESTGKLNRVPGIRFSRPVYNHSQDGEIVYAYAWVPIIDPVNTQNYVGEFEEKDLALWQNITARGLEVHFFEDKPFPLERFMSGRDGTI